MFGSVTTELLPFVHIPIIKDLIPGQLKVFLLSGGYSDVSKDMLINSISSSLHHIRDSLIAFGKDLEICAKETAVKLLQLTDFLWSNINNIETGLGNYLSNVGDTIEFSKNITEALSNLTTLFTEADNCNLRSSFTNFVENVRSNLSNVQSVLLTTIQSSSQSLTSALQNNIGFGLQYKGVLTLDVLLGKPLTFDLITLEYVESDDSLGQCSRFYKAYEILEGEESWRFSVHVFVPVGIPIPPFIEIVPVGFGFAQSRESSKFVVQMTAEIKPFLETGILKIGKVFDNGYKATAQWTVKKGAGITVDLFITNKAIFAYTEATFFGLFYVQLDFGVIFGDRESQFVKLYMDGRFILRGNKDVRDVTNQNQDIDAVTEKDSFSASLFDFILRLIEDFANAAFKRLEDAKRLVSEAQTKLSKALEWLEEKKEVVRAIQRKLDNAVDYLEEKKTDLEKAKSVFNSASSYLKEQKERVERLCTIKRCNRICIPGVKCGWFYCKLTRCMISIDDPLCVVKNIACSLVRAAVLAVYDLAILALNVPLLALDAAKGALWLAQVAVDRFSASLELANVAIDIAKIGVKAASVGLDVVNVALDAVEVVVKIGMEVFSFIIEYGLSKVIDVRNCGFGLEMEKPIQPVFEVYCEIKPFNTKWIPISLHVNFLNPMLTLWYAAKDLVNNMVNLVGIFGRKKRDITQEYMSYMHPLLRKAREESNLTETDLENSFENLAKYLNESNFGTFPNSSFTENKSYDQSVLIYNEKCEVLTKSTTFLEIALHHLSNVTFEFAQRIDELDQTSNNLSQLNT